MIDFCIGFATCYLLTGCFCLACALPANITLLIQEKPRQRRGFFLPWYGIAFMSLVMVLSWPRLLFKLILDQYN